MDDTAVATPLNLGINRLDRLPSFDSLWACQKGREEIKICAGGLSGRVRSIMFRSEVGPMKVQIIQIIIILMASRERTRGGLQPRLSSRTPA
ncbi:hypothetical protein TNCV_1787861 [Trichonephila clavipes]|nr:hypothetical protein TNCV_1787861 [Trichonephila clavipes]